MRRVTPGMALYHVLPFLSLGGRVDIPDIQYTGMRSGPGKGTGRAGRRFSRRYTGQTIKVKRKMAKRSRAINRRSA